MEVHFFTKRIQYIDDDFLGIKKKIVAQKMIVDANKNALCNRNAEDYKRSNNNEDILFDSL